MDDDADLELLRLKRKRQAKAKRSATIKLALVGLGVAAIAVLLVVALNRSGGRATNGGFSLSLGGPSNHEELAEEVRKKGFVVRVESGGPLMSTPERPMSFFCLGESALDPRPMVYLNKSESAAQDQVKTMGDNGFVYGRFVFEDWQHHKPESRAAFLKLRKALTGR